MGKLPAPHHQDHPAIYSLLMIDLVFGWKLGIGIIFGIFPGYFPCVEAVCERLGIISNKSTT
jgi:hypothetical protein